MTEKEGGGGVNGTLIKYEREKGEGKRTSNKKGENEWRYGGRRFGHLRCPLGCSSHCMVSHVEFDHHCAEEEVRSQRMEE